MTSDEKKMMQDLYNKLVGTPTQKGFISEMYEFRNSTKKHLDNIDNKLEEVNPVIKLFSHWKFISGLAVGITGFVAGILAAMYYIISLFYTRGGS